MVPKLIRFLGWLSLALITLLALGLIYMKSLPANFARVTVINKSNEIIDSGSIDLCGEKASIGKLWPKDELQLKLAIHYDCHYEVKIIFSSGKEISEGIGYVTNGMDSDDEILVFDDKFELGNTKSNRP